MSHPQDPPSPQVPPSLLTPSEVATIFRVDVKTVGRWAKTGRLKSVRTPGGHHRYDKAEVHALAGLAATR